MFFNENGILCIDEVVAANPSWQKIMEDGIVTDDEIRQQAETVTNLLHDIDKGFTEEQKALVQTLLAEASVLFAAHHVHSLQTITNK